MAKPTKVFNKGLLVWQTAGEEDGVPELPILVHVDNSGNIVLSQEDRDIVVTRGTIKDLCWALKQPD